MSFPKANLKRFNDISGCAPPVGLYNPKELEKKKNPAFDKSDRFQNQKDDGPAPNAFDISACSTFGTPKKKKNFNVTIHDPSNTSIKHSDYYESLKAEIISLKQLLFKKDKEIKRLQSELDETVVTLLTDLQVFQAITLSLEEKIDELETSQDGTDQKTTSFVLTDEISKVISDGNKASTSDKLKIAKENAKIFQAHFQHVITESEKKIKDIKVSMDGKMSIALERQNELECELQHVQENLDSAISCSQTLQKYRDSMEQQNDRLRKQVRTLDTEQLDLEEKIRYLKGEVFAISDEKLQEAQSLFEANAEIAEYKEQLEQLEEDRKTLNFNIQAMTEKYQELDETLATVKQDSRREIEELGAQLSVIMGNLKSEKTECESLKKLNKEFMETITQKQNEIETLSLQLETEKKETIQLQENAVLAEDSITDLEIQLEASRVQLRNTQETVEKSMEEITELQEKIEVVKSQEKEIKMELEEERNMNQQTARGHADRILALEQIEIQMQDQNSRLTEELEELKLAKKSAENRIGELEQEIQDLSDKVEDGKKTALETQEQTQQEKQLLHTQITDLSDTKLKLETDLVNFECQIDSISKLMDNMRLETDEKISVLTSQLENMTENNVANTELITGLESEKMACQKEVLALENRLQLAEFEIKQNNIDCASAVKNAEDQLKCISEKLEITMQANVDLNRVKSQLEADALDSNYKLEKNMKEIGELQAKMREMTIKSEDQILDLKSQVEQLVEEKTEISDSLVKLEGSMHENEIEFSSIKRKLQLAEMENEQQKFTSEATIQQTRDELETVKLRLVKAGKEAQENEQIKTDLQKDLYQCKEKFMRCEEECQNNVSEKKKEIQERQKEITEFREENTELQKVVRDLQNTISEQENCLTSANSKLLVLQMEIDTHTEMQISLQKTTQLLEETQEEKDKMMEKLEFLQAQVSEQEEQMENMKTYIERMQSEHEDVISNLESLHSAEISHLQRQIPSEEQEGRLQQLNQMVEKWRSMHEALQAKVEPFMKQLDAYELEKQALLGRSKDAQTEMEILSRRYAQVLGHQNQKQKIHHITKIKDENNTLKKEVSSLREKEMKQNRVIHRLEEKLAGLEGKKKFDPSRAFKHAKEDRQPMQSPLKDGNRK